MSQLWQILHTIRAVQIRRLVVSLLMVPMLVACGGEDEPEDAAEPSASGDGGDVSDSVCDLISTDEVTIAVGVTVQDGVGASGPVATGGTQSTCTWRAVESTGDVATVTIYSEASAADSVRQADDPPLPEVGEDAFVSSFASVWGYAGDGSFFTQWYDFAASDEENLPKSTALALLVMEKL